eukprot:TRINITY_DN4184_c0_g1_i3.p1 TRINITY_DN4184_c0_g1~~TRINITY_DN4184_c0_g1_i3.p1  ORF type:complete len:269 (-),score=44.78 TRINITY_DN4184_c0_g1_i3:129-887(-)
MEEGEVVEEMEIGGRGRKEKLTPEQNELFTQMVEEHSDIMTYVLKGERTSNLRLKEIYKDFGKRFNERAGANLAHIQIKKKVDYLKVKARKEGSLLAGIDVLSTKRDHHSVYNKGSPRFRDRTLPHSSRLSARGSGSSPRNDKSASHSNDSSSYLSKELMERQLSEASVQAEATELYLENERIRYERENILLETAKLNHAIARENYQKMFGKYPDESNTDMKVQVFTDESVANNEYIDDQEVIEDIKEDCIL